MIKLPWEPIYTIERSDMPEVTIFGVISVVSGLARNEDGKVFAQQLVSVGDVGHLLWTRSLLKPWQLLSHLPQIRKKFPALTSEHLALMMSSHNAEPHHLELLKEIAQIGNLDESHLKCPPSYPLSQQMRLKHQADGVAPKPLFHNCSGKHFSYLLDVKIRGGDPERYLKPEEPQFSSLRKLLAYLLGRANDQFATTIDGCQLPNYGLSAVEIACLYHGLLSPVPPYWTEPASDDLANQVQCLNTVGQWMRQFPEVIGGLDRLDSRLTKGDLSSDKTIITVAKNGADGLLGIAVAPCKKYVNGLGVLIKLSSGYDLKHMQVVVSQLFERLELTEPASVPQTLGIRTDHIKTKFHF